MLWAQEPIKHRAIFGAMVVTPLQIEVKLSILMLVIISSLKTTPKAFAGRLYGLLPLIRQKCRKLAAF